VVQDGRTVLRKGYGLANLEWNLPVEPDTVFRVGSVTKQFTAVAILMLLEQGKLALEDPITRFLLDYPTQAHCITVEHLLTHTSGIMSFTDMPEWPPVMRQDMNVQTLVDFFKYRPMRSAPGTCYAYNNSGYVLLGAIIEQAGGQTYEQFIQEHLFGPAGMRHSYYDMPEKIIPRRAAGYSRGLAGFANATYISMTQPFAAGGLASTVDDLALWSAALDAGTLLRPETLSRAWTPYRLAGGAATTYGYGWGLAEYAGRRVIEHGGGIEGFTAYTLKLPEERSFVAVLSNNEARSGLPEKLAVQCAGLLVGVPYPERPVVTADPEILARCAGKYLWEEGGEVAFVYEDGRLYVEFGPGMRQELLPVAPYEFVMRDMLGPTRFASDETGTVSVFEWLGRAVTLRGRRAESTQ